MAEFVGDGVTEESWQAHMSGFVEAHGTVIEEVGVTAGSVGGEIGDAHGELVQIEGVFGNAELKMLGEISGFALSRVLQTRGGERAVQPVDSHSGLAEDAVGI
jgi:hypothetical protein